MVGEGGDSCQLRSERRTNHGRTMRESRSRRTNEAAVVRNLGGSFAYSLRCCERIGGDGGPSTSLRTGPSPSMPQNEPFSRLTGGRSACPACLGVTLGEAGSEAEGPRPPRKLLRGPLESQHRRSAPARPLLHCPITLRAGPAPGNLSTDHALDVLPGQLLAGIFEYLARRAVFDQFAQVHEDDIVGQ